MKKQIYSTELADLQELREGASGNDKKRIQKKQEEIICPLWKILKMNTTKP